MLDVCCVGPNDYRNQSFPNQLFQMFHKDAKRLVVFIQKVAGLVSSVMTTGHEIF